MADQQKRYLERVVAAAVSPEMGQALVIIYCRHLCDARARSELRALVGHAPEVLKQFDALDELHAEYPFTKLSQFTIDEELALLYWNHRQQGTAEMMEELRRLCRVRLALLERFDQLDDAELN